MKKIQGYIYIVIGVILIFTAAYIVKHNFDENAKAGASSDALLDGVIQQMPNKVLPGDFKGPMPIVDVEGSGIAAFPLCAKGAYVRNAIGWIKHVPVCPEIVVKGYEAE